MTSIVNIYPVDLYERLHGGEEVLIVDVREAGEVAYGKIPGAKHISLGELANRSGELSRDVETVLVCQSGARSRAACEYLQSIGFQNVKNMAGGMNGWAWRTE